MKIKMLLILTTAMIMTIVSFACAEEAKDIELFGLWESGGEQEKWIAPAVPAAEGIVIVPAALIPEETDHLFVSDGTQRWQAKAVIPDDSDVIAMVFYDAHEEQLRGGAWPLLPWGESVPAVSCRVHSVNAEGGRSDCGVLASEEIHFRGMRCLLLTLTDRPLPGSPLVTDDGRLAGIVVADWAEGINRAVAVPSDEIAGSLLGAASLLNNLPGWQDAPEGLNVTVEKNFVMIDWSQMTLPVKAEGEELYMILLDTGNNYLNYYPAETEQRSMMLTLTPGRFYLIGVVSCAGAPDSVPEDYACFSVPQAKKLTEHTFRPVVTAVAEAPEAGLKDGENPKPVKEVTEELLRSGRAYFYSHSTYEVTETIDNKTLLISLTDPNGVNYCYESGWIYSPDYMTEDIWFLSMEETGLTVSLNRNGYPAGVYQLAFYVDGDLADMIEFELK